MVVKGPKKCPREPILARHILQKGASLTCRRKETIMLVALSTRLITCASSYLRERVWVVCTWIEASELAE